MLPSAICGLLELHEIADVHVGAELRARTQARKGTDEAAGAELALFEHAIGWTTVSAPMRHVAQHDVRTDAHAIAERDLAFEQHVGIDEHIAAHG